MNKEPSPFINYDEESKVFTLEKDNPSWKDAIFKKFDCVMNLKES